MNDFKGTGVAIVTPFNADKSVDYKGLEHLVEHLIANGINYLVVQGTTGESVTLNKEEKEATLAFIIKVNNGRLPIVLGIGGNCTATVMADFQTRDLTGVAAILSVCPYYNKPTQEGIYQHYAALAEVATVPIIVYNVPGRTGTNILAETTLSLANNFENIIGVKEASGNLEQCMEIINGKPKDFLVISGDDALTLPIISVGGVGVISVLANAFPKGFSGMVQSALNNDIVAARALHYKYFSMIDLLFVEGNPAGVKAALKHLKIIGDAVRLPLVNVSEKTNNTIKEVLITY